MSKIPLSILFSLAAATVGSLSSVAMAGENCIETLSEELQKEFDAKVWSFHGVRSLNADSVTDKLSMYSGAKRQMGENEQETIAEFASRPGFEFYLITGTSDYSVGFMDVVIVDAKTCQQVKRKTVYFD